MVAEVERRAIMVIWTVSKSDSLTIGRRQHTSKTKNPIVAQYIQHVHNKPNCKAKLNMLSCI